MPIQDTGLLKGKVALITGAGSGIGRATAHYMANAGAKVVVADLDVQSGEQAVSDLRRAGHESTFVQVNVTSAEQVQRMIDTTLNHYGRLDILHNNAGVIGMHGNVEDASFEEWKRIIDIDLNSVFLGCKYGVAALKKSGGGTIVNTASRAGIQGFPNGLHYAAAKAGVVMMTKSLAALLEGDNIKVNSLCPTLVDTNLLKGMAGATQEAAATRYSPAMLKADDVARAVLFLATKADFTGGAVIIEIKPNGKPKYAVAFDFKRIALRGI
ncbi:SDR family NAD(P)-dependent oxidoreductase [Chloroflexota bacterium]